MLFRKNTVFPALCAFLVLTCARADAQQPATETPQPQAQPAPAPTPQPQPPAPPAAEGKDEIDGGGSVMLFYWLGHMHPKMRTGETAVSTNYPSDFDYPGKNKDAPGVIVSFPAGQNNAIRFTWFRVMGQGNTTAPQNLHLFDQDYTQGEYMSTAYTLQNFKLSLDFLTWPFPEKGRTFRVKTLWEVQYTTIKSSFDAPLRVVNDAISFAGTKKSNSFFWPSFGMGVEKRFTPAIRWEAKGAGFGVPGHALTWDADTFFAFKQGQFEFLVGGKAFYFRTSPNDTEYVFGTMLGGYAGVRWYPRF